MVITVGLNASLDRTAIVDELKPGKINRFDRAIETAGGKGLNVSRVLKKLEVDVVATGLLGGKIGEKLALLLDEEGIKHDFIRIAGETRTCLAVVDKKNNNAITELNENGPVVTAREMQQLYSKLEKLKPDTRIVAISGSIPGSLPSTTYYDLINIAKSRNLLTALDARGEALKKGIEAHPYIIKPNRAEAEELLGFTLDNEEKLVKGLKFLLEYCNIAVITLEGSGCIIGSKDECYKVVPPVLKAVNTVGSGDSFLAGLIFAALNNKPLAETGIWGITTGSANAMTERAGFCNSEDIEAIFPQVKVEKVW